MAVCICSYIAVHTFFILFLGMNDKTVLFKTTDKIFRQFEGSNSPIWRDTMIYSPAEPRGNMERPCKFYDNLWPVPKRIPL